MSDNPERATHTTPTNGAEKSERILQYLEKHPDATDEEIQAALAAEDINASPELIDKMRKRAK